MTTSTGFDVVIVGGGPAGAVLANRLTTNQDRSVLLVEAGPDYGTDPGGWPEELLYTEQQPLESHSWRLRDAGSGIPLPRARVLGGSSAVNACYWIRGSASDFDEWESLGNQGWSFDGLLPFFRRAEADPLGGHLHGTNGPVPVMRATQLSPGDVAFTEAAASLGLARVEDINGERSQSPAVGPAPRNIVADQRFNAALSYLAPARDRSNLTIRANTLIDRVLFDGNRATRVVKADGEEIRADLVILAAGAYFTPGILNRSGYGNEPDLNRLGIPVLQHLPGVGRNLLDHPFAVAVAAGRLAPDAEYGRQTQGQVMATSRSPGTTAEIDCHIYNGQNFDPDARRWVISLGVSMVSARSTGTVTLTSLDPSVAPRIEHLHYSDPGDLDRMCDGIEVAMEIFRSRPFSDVVEPLDHGIWHWDERSALRSLVIERSFSTNHCSGTAKMGPPHDPLAVVDASGHVYGAEGLVVVDSSVFPTVPRGNIHFPVVAVAEKIAEALI